MLRALKVLVLVLVSGPALARDPFSLDVAVDGQTGSRSFTTLEEAYNALSTASLRSIVPNYTEISAATSVLSLRGVQATASFAANSPVLQLQVPGLGIAETFNGSTREASRRLLERWLQGRDGRPGADALLRYSVSSTPIDPIAGNPNAALTGLAISDFGRAVEASLGDGGAAGIGARFGSFSAGGYDSRNISLPLDYSWRVTERDSLQIDVPLSYTDTGGAASYSGNLGLLYRRRVLENWTVQASGRVGAAGSVDLGAGAGIYGLGLTSTLVLPVSEDFRLTVANGVNYLSTFPVSIGRYSLDYGVSNTVFRNGAVLTRSLGLELWGWPLTGSAFAVDTRFSGTAVFVRHFQEFGAFVSAGRQASGGLGVALLTGDRGLLGFTVNTGVRF